MDVLKAWKLQKGRGTYVYGDGVNHYDTIEHLIQSIARINDSIKAVCAKNIVEYSNNLIGNYFVPYEDAIVPKPDVFLLVVLNVEEIPRDIFSIIIDCNPHKYLFCTSTTDDLNRYHLKEAPIIKFDVTNKTKGITASQRIIYNIGLDLVSDDQLYYDGLTDRMNDIFTYFDGDFDTINNCYTGNRITGKTADVFRREFATKMGWTDTMDTSIEYYDNIDKFFNPNYVYEQAKLYMELMSKRNHYIDEHMDKVKYAVKLLLYNSEKRFIVICKNGAMADAVTRALYAANNSYHSRAIHTGLSPVNFNDEDGNVVVYKSGARKGQPRDYGAKTQTDMYLGWFNTNRLKAIIMTNAPEKDIELDMVDGIISLSPKNKSYEELQERINIKLNGNTNLVNVYISGTTDETKLRAGLTKGKYDGRYYGKGDFNKLLFD